MAENKSCPEFMKRRSFLKVLAGAALAVAALPFEFQKPETRFDPIKYKGDWKWVYLDDRSSPRYRFEDGKWVRCDNGFFHGYLENPDWVDAPREEIWWHIDIPITERI
jgi:hypothetical protein